MTNHEGDLSPGVQRGEGGLQSSPVRCSSRSSSQSDNTPPAMATGVLYSPEDTLNNDFFYDEEFTVQFDANLGAGEDDLLDSIDINRILEQVGVAGQNPERGCPGNRMVTSKSDSCLYQGDVDLTDSEQNMSSSEHEIFSSSDMSDFKNELLFSPQPPPDDSSSDTLPPDLGGSLERDQERYSFDWKATKDQYMISFDRSPTKSSHDGSYHEHQGLPTSPGLLTCWAQKSNGSQLSWGSGSDSKKGSSPDGPGSSCALSSGAYSNGNDSHRGSSSDTSTSSTMTTWKALKHQKKRWNKVPDGMTTWQRLKETRSQAKMEGSWGPRSKSMPELKTVAEGLEGKDTREEMETEDVRESEALRATSYPKRHSTSLVELYRQMKYRMYSDLGIGLSRPSTEATTLTGLGVDTWSMSGSGTTHPSVLAPFLLSPGALTDVRTRGLVSWDTKRNLATAVDSTDSIKRLIETGTMSEWKEFLRKKPRLDSAIQAGSIIGPRNDIYGSRSQKGHIAVQHPPNVVDCGVQTSFTHNTSHHHRSQHKSLQTSLEGSVLKERVLLSTEARPVPRQSRPSQKPLWDVNNSSTVVQLSSQGKERMTRSLFFAKCSLPDLSFLAKPLSHSTNNADQFDEPLQIDHLNQTCKNDRVPRTSTPKTSRAMDFRPKKPPRQPSLSQSREGSPAMLKARCRSSDSSVCSSSSSGIDPGSNECLAQRSASVDSGYDREGSPRCPAVGKPVGRTGKTLHPRCNQDMYTYTTARCDLDRDTVGKAGLYSQETLSVQVGDPESRAGIPEMPVRKVCNVCRTSNSTTSIEKVSPNPAAMTSSHPVCCYHNAAPQTFHPTPTSAIQAKIPKQLCSCGHCLLPESQYTTFTVEEHCCPECKTKFQASSPTHSTVILRRAPRTSCTGSEKKPLKSCLAKKAQDRNIVALKHRSWSDPSDATVLKHSQEGQIRYELITHDKDCMRKQPRDAGQSGGKNSDIPPPVPPHGINAKAVEVGVAREIENGNHANPGPSCCGGDMHHSSDPASHHGHRVFHAPATPPNSPEQIPVPTCMCGTTHAVLHSSSDSGESSSCTPDIYRAKKSVSFSEEVSYHSPNASPLHSPRKASLGCDRTREEGVVRRHPLSRDMLRKPRPLSIPPGVCVLVCVVGA